MSTGAAICSSCGYENVVVGCGFCLQCGEEFPASTTVAKETTAQESQVAPQENSPVTEGQPIASVQESPAAAAPNSEAVFATVAHSNSQYVGCGGSTFPADDVLEGFSTEPSVPSGGTEAFQSALLAAEENDSFFEEAASPGEDPIFAAAEVDEPSQQQPENVVLPDESNDADEHAPVNDEANEPIVEAFEPTAETSEPAVDTFEFEPGEESGRTEVEVYESADEIGEPTTEPCESEDEAGEPEVTPDQSGEETFEGAFETESGGEFIGAEEAIEPRDETDEQTFETIESAPEAIGAGGEAVEPSDEPTEQTFEAFESMDDVIEPGVEALEAADAAIESAIDAFQPATDTLEQSDEVSVLAVETTHSTDVESEPRDETAELVGEMNTVVADDSEMSDEPLDDLSESDAEPEMITETAADEDTVETDAADEAETTDSAFADALFHELDRLITTGARSIGLQLCATEQGMSGELEIDGRKQKVYVQRNYNSSGTPMVSLFASCGPASQQHAIPLLEWNSALPMCAFAIRDIENTPTFVTQANVPAFSLDKMMIAATIKEIAKRADQVQQRIG